MTSSPSHGECPDAFVFFFVEDDRGVLEGFNLLLAPRDSLGIVGTRADTRRTKEGERKDARKDERKERRRGGRREGRTHGNNSKEERYQGREDG